MKSYDRIDGETTKAYAAFSVYRDMGATRSLDRVAAEIYPTQTPHKRHPNLTTLNRWSSQNNWVDRCRDFDLDEEKRQRDRMRAENDEVYFQKIESYRDRVEGVGAGILALSAKYLAAIDRRSKRIFTEIQSAERQNRPACLSPEEEEFFLAVPNAIRAIAIACASGSQLNGDGLGIRKLIDDRDEILGEGSN